MILKVILLTLILSIASKKFMSKNHSKGFVTIIDHNKELYVLLNPSMTLDDIITDYNTDDFDDDIAEEHIAYGMLNKPIKLKHLNVHFDTNTNTFEIFFKHSVYSPRTILENILPTKYTIDIDLKNQFKITVCTDDNQLPRQKQLTFTFDSPEGPIAEEGFLFDYHKFFYFSLHQYIAKIEAIQAIIRLAEDLKVNRDSIVHILEELCNLSILEPLIVDTDDKLDHDVFIDNLKNDIEMYLTKINIILERIRPFTNSLGFFEALLQRLSVVLDIKYIPGDEENVIKTFSDIIKNDIIEHHDEENEYIIIENTKGDSEFKKQAKKFGKIFEKYDIK
jgi:hypothetical protein